MPFCGNCGTEIPAGVKFCGKCGNPLASGQSPVTYQSVKSGGIKPPPTIDDFDDIEKRKRVDRVGIGLGIGGCFAMPLVVLFIVLLTVFLMLKFACEVFSDNSSVTNSEQQRKVAAPTRQNNTGSAQSAVPAPTLRGAFSIQIMADGDIDVIQKEKNKAQPTINQPVFLVFIEPWYKLWVGDFSTKAQAEAFLPTVKSKGYKDAWIVSTKAITGSTQNDVSGGKIDSRLCGPETEWCNDDICIWFKYDGTYSRWSLDDDRFSYEGTWNTSGNNITITDKGGTIMGSYSVNSRGHDRILRINNEEYIDKYEGDD
jgi:hypothetical protein